MDVAFASLTRLVNERFAHYLSQLPGETPEHRVDFSRRITRSWALIYYRRHLVRLSPYVFLLDEDELQHGTHWRELDATLRHEAVHAHLYARTRHTGHGPEFQRILEGLGVRANGSCDLGPENVAFRYVYECPSCEVDWPRRAPLQGNVSCGSCAPGAYHPAYRMSLKHHSSPWARLVDRRALVEATLAEGLADVAPLTHTRAAGTSARFAT